MTGDPTDEIERLHRQLRAMSVVNRQLHAQLEMVTSSASAKPRRGGSADQWLAELSSRPRPDIVEVVATEGGAIWVREGDMRRQLKAGLLAPALEEHLGPRRFVDDAELERWTVGPPMEPLEAPSGPSFLLVGGQRLSLRGLPAPYPVGQDRASRLPQGPELNVMAAWQQRQRLLSRPGTGGSTVPRHGAPGEAGGAQGCQERPALHRHAVVLNRSEPRLSSPAPRPRGHGRAVPRADRRHRGTGRRAQRAARPRAAARRAQDRPRPSTGC